MSGLFRELSRFLVRNLMHPIEKCRLFSDKCPVFFDRQYARFLIADCSNVPNVNVPMLVKKNFTVQAQVIFYRLQVKVISNDDFRVTITIFSRNSRKLLNISARFGNVPR